MKSEDSNKHAEHSIEKRLGFPYKIPVIIDRVKLGDVTIDYSINKDIMPLENNMKEFYLTFDVVAELSSLKLYLNKEINISNKLIEVVSRNKFLQFLKLFYGAFSERPWDIIDDEKIFDLIKSEGPISLRNSRIQIKLKAWLNDENVAGAMVSKLSESLLGYASISPKRGRSQDRTLVMIGNKLIKDVYRDFSSILKIAKKKRESYRSNETRKFIIDASKIHLYSEDANYLKTNSPICEVIQNAMMMKTYMSKAQYDNGKRGEAEVDEKADKILVKYFENMGPPNIISSCIESDKELKDWFDTFRWDPHEMAREIIAKQFDVSEDTIINILYRKKIKS